MWAVREPEMTCRFGVGRCAVYLCRKSVGISAFWWRGEESVVLTRLPVRCTQEMSRVQLETESGVWEKEVSR